MTLRYRWKTRPYRHQVRAVKKLVANGYGGALLMEPRTGKTKTVIDWLSILAQAGKVRRVIIVAPLVVLGVWEEELKTHCPFRVKVVVWDKDGRKSEPLPNDPHRLNIVLLNYEAFSVPDVVTIKGKRRKQFGKKALRSALRAWRAHAMVLDESHRIKSPGSTKSYYIWSTAWEYGRSRQVPKAELIPYRAIMTGTPVTKRKRVFDIYSQWKFLNPHRFADLGTFDLFKSYYGVWLEMKGYEKWIKNINQDDLRKRIEEDAFQITREECFDLPPRIDEAIPVQLSDETMRIYEDMEEEMLAKLKTGEITTASIRLVQGLRLAQITSGLTKTDEGKLYAISDEKLSACRDLLEDLFAAEEKVVIAARFKGDHTRLARLGAKHKVPVYLVVGGQRRKDRDAAVRAFRAKAGPSLIIVQPQAAGIGIDLSTASVMIWYSLTTSWVDYTQTCDRIALSDKKTTFYYLIAQGTIDEDMLEALREDKEVGEVFLERMASA